MKSKELIHKIIVCLLFFATNLCNATVVKWDLIEVVNGDTFLFEIPNMPNEIAYIYVKVSELDTPEASGVARCPRERRLGGVAKSYVESIVSYKNIKVDVKGWNRGGGSVLADVYVDGMNFKELMISKGLGKHNPGIRRIDWCN